jgi:uncharacterized protein YyaL (SSP411 family)
VADALTRARLTLFERRASRPRPHLDDKVLTGWNGLMIAAFARGARVLSGGAALGQEVAGDPGWRHLQSAHSAAAFLREQMWDDGRRVLRRRYRGGDAAIDGYAEDYACLVFGLLELFSASGDAEWLEWAIELQRRQDDLFWDDGGGGWFSTTGHDPSVLMRIKEDYDGAEPAASSVGALNLLSLAHLTGDERYRPRADAVFRAFASRLSGYGRTLPMLAAALSVAHAAPEQIVVVGEHLDANIDRLWRAAHRRYRPFAQIVRLTPGDAQERVAGLMPWAKSMAPIRGTAAAYVCRNFVCDAPTTDAGSLE